MQDWSELPLDPAAAALRLRQGRIAVEVLERSVLARRPDWTRDHPYREMAHLGEQGNPPARPRVLLDMFDAYLTELGTSRAEIA